MKQITKVTSALIVLHSLILVFVVTSILSNNEADSPMYWLILLPIDLPAFAISYITAPFLETSFANLAIQFPITSPLNDPLNFWYPAFAFGLLGTIQWLFLPKLIMCIYKWAKVRKANKSSNLTGANDAPPS